MASLLSFAKGVGRQLNPFDNGATYANPHPVAAAPTPQTYFHGPTQLPGQILQRAPTAAPAPPQVHAPSPVLNTIAHLATSPFAPIINAGAADINLTKYLAGKVTNNQTAAQHGLNAAKANVNATLDQARQFTTRPAVQLATSLVPRQLTTTPTTPLARALLGSTPVQNVEKGVVSNYQAHPGLPRPLRVGLAGAYGAGQLAQDAPIAGGALKGAKALAASDSLKALDANQIGAVGKNVKPVAPITDTKANAGGNMASNEQAAYARTFGVTKAQASQAIQDLARQRDTGLPVKPVNTSVTTSDKVLANSTGETPAKIAADRVVAEQKEAALQLSKMPAPSRKLPAATPVSGDLAPIKTPNTLKQTFASKVTAIRNLGTPSAQKLADTIQNVDKTKQDLQAKYMYQMPTAQKLGAKDFTNMVDTIEGKAKASSPEVAQAAKETSSALKQVNNDAFSQGTLIGSRKNYFPHSYDYNAIKRNSSQYDAALQHLIDTGQAKTPENAVQLFNEQSKAQDLWGKTYGNLENTRNTDMPGYAKTKDALNKYVGAASDRIARATHLGTEDEIARRLIGNIRIEGGNADTAAKAVENYLRSPDTGKTLTSKAVSSARGVFGAASLSKAPISHLGQTSNTAVEAGIGNTLKGWTQHLLASPESKDFVAKTGVNNPQNLHAYQDQYTSLRGAMSSVTAKGLTPVMRMNRSVTALAGRAYGNHLAATGDTAKLESLGVTGKVGKTLTPTQEVQAARGLVNQTMFSGSRATTPIGAETVLGKTVGQFRTAYAYKQTGFLYKQVLQEAQKGNLAPLARFIGTTIPVAGVTLGAKSALSGSNSFAKEGPGGKALDIAGAVGGIPGELAVQAGRYGSRAGDLTNTAVSAAVPLAGEGLTVGSALDSLLHGKGAPAGRLGLSAVPVVGGQLKNTLLPTKTQTSAANAASPTALPTNSAAAKTASTKQLAQFKASAGQGYGLYKLPDGKYAYNINGNVSTTSNLKTAQTAILKDSFKQSGQAYRVVGDNVVTLSSAGNPTVTPKIQYDYNVGAASLIADKSAGNLNAWMSTAQSQLANISNQLSSGNLDPLAAAKLQNDAATIQTDMAKYQSYGGFTKGSSSGSGGWGSSGSSAKPKIPNFKIAASTAKAPKVGKISVKASGKTSPKFKTPKVATTKTTGIRVPKLTNKTPKVAQAKTPVNKIKVA